MSEESSNRGGRSQVSTVDLMVIIIIVLFARFFPYGSGRTIVRSLVEVGAIALMAFLTSLLIRIWQYPQVVDGSKFFSRLFLFTYVSNLVFNAVAILITDLIFYYRWTNRKAVAAEAEQRATARPSPRRPSSGPRPTTSTSCSRVRPTPIFSSTA